MISIDIDFMLLLGNLTHCFSFIADDGNGICNFTLGKSCGYILSQQYASGQEFERTTLESGKVYL